MQELRTNLMKWYVGLFEQNALTFLMRTKPDLTARVFFDQDRFGLNTWCAPSAFLFHACEGQI